MQLIGQWEIMHSRQVRLRLFYLHLLTVIMRTVGLIYNSGKQVYHSRFLVSVHKTLTCEHIYRRFYLIVFPLQESNLPHNYKKKVNYTIECSLL